MFSSRGERVGSVPQFPPAGKLAAFSHPALDVTLCMAGGSRHIISWPPWECETVGGDRSFDFVPIPLPLSSRAVGPGVLEALTHSRKPHHAHPVPTATIPVQATKSQHLHSTFFMNEILGFVKVALSACKTTFCKMSSLDKSHVTEFWPMVSRCTLLTSQHAFQLESHVTGPGQWAGP